MYHKKIFKNVSNEYHFLVDVHYENYHDFQKPKKLLFVGCIFHEEGKQRNNIF